MKMTCHRCVLKRIPTMHLALRSVAYPKTPSRRNATMMTLLPVLVLGFPPVLEGVRRKGVHVMPSRKEWRRPWASPRRLAKPTRISPDPQPTTPTCSTKLAAQQHMLPRSCDHVCRLTVAGQEEWEGPTEMRNSGTTASRERTASTSIGGDRPDAAIETNHPLLARLSPRCAREVFVAALQ
jgi:hypothetical protein